MPRFRILAQVTVAHDYFADGGARHLRFAPHAGTAAFLRRFDMVVRSDERSLVIGVNEDQLPGIWSEREDDEHRELKFDVHTTDPAGAYYTDASPVAVEPGAEAGQVMLTTPAVAYPSPLASIAMPLVPEHGNDFATWTEGLGATYRLNLSSPQTIWKYLLVGDWRGRTLSIVDQRGEVAFTDPVAERLPDGQNAWVARSTSPIALRERPPQRFQLRDVTDTPERVLISRLPGAQPQRLWREMLGGQPTIVSEIFVHS